MGGLSLASLVLLLILGSQPAGGQTAELSGKAAGAAAEVAKSATLEPKKGDEGKGLELQSASKVIWASAKDVRVTKGMTDVQLSESLDRIEVEIGSSDGKGVFASAWVGSIDGSTLDTVAQSYSNALGAAASKLGVASCSGTLQCVETCIGKDGKRKCCKYRCVPGK